MFKKLWKWLTSVEPVAGEKPAPVITQPIQHVLELMDKTPDRFVVTREDVSNRITMYHCPQKYRYTISDTSIPDIEFIVYIATTRMYNCAGDIMRSVTSTYPAWVSIDEAEALSTKAEEILEVGYKKQREEEERQRIIEAKKEVYKQQRDKDRVFALYGEVDT